MALSRAHGSHLWSCSELRDANADLIGAKQEVPSDPEQAKQALKTQMEVGSTHGIMSSKYLHAILQVIGATTCV